MDIQAAIQGCKPAIAEEFKRTVGYIFKNMVEDLGTELRGIYNTTWAKPFASLKHMFEDTTPVTYGMRQGKSHWTINQEWLTAGADRYADDVAAAWMGKIQAKVGELDNANVEHLSGTTFLITGTKAGKDVRIEQRSIVNCKGHTVFNQWPARIYVDGKLISEAAYKRMG